ncbi:hypothetical protein MNB_SV-9-791 [hydrothermal vent metagenome]|uniref:Uncharacterized protein n=1 Tax=hydrothermal vent metagenome TaxID=652676 RepID=A0A1W1C444_9ZZZZ
MNEEDMIKRVFLLGILKKESGETLNDVTKYLVNTGMFDMKEAKKVLKELKDKNYIVKEELSIKGLAIAKEAEAEFKL